MQTPSVARPPAGRLHHPLTLNLTQARPPPYAQVQQGIKWCERADEVVLAAIAGLIGVQNLPDRARAIAVMAPRLTGAGFPLGQDRAGAAALAFSDKYMVDFPEDQLRETECSAYMEEIGMIRARLIEQTPALAEILESPVRSRLLARFNHVINDKKAIEFLNGLPGDIAILRTTMAAGATHLDVIGTSDSEFLPNKAWIGLTRKHFSIALLTSSQNPMESGFGCTERCLVCGARFDPGGNHALFCDGGTWGVAYTYLKHNVKVFLVAVPCSCSY